MKHVQPTPDWLVQFNKNFDGVAGQIMPRHDRRQALRAVLRLQAADCAGHKFDVLFDAGGARAFGALGGKDNAPAYFGAPSPAEQEALAKALSPVAAAEAAQPKSRIAERLARGVGQPRNPGPSPCT